MILCIFIGLCAGYYISSTGAAYAAATAISAFVFVVRVVISGRNEASDAIGLLIFVAVALLTTAAARAYRDRQRKRAPY